VPEPCVTTAVCADVAVLEPVVFVAVTATRIVFPLSVLVSVYVLCVAEAIAAHAAPLASQRDHAYAYVMPVPVHVPGLAVRVCPTTVGPTIVGIAVFGGPAWPLIVAVALDATVSEPSALDPVTRTRRREPTSPAATT